MSLQYIIDGYNIIHHPNFTKACKKKHDLKTALLEFIRLNRLTGSLKNKIILVFDGYPDGTRKIEDDNIDIIFSRGQSADEKIKKLVEASGNRKNIVVVSDDKEIKFAVKALGIQWLSVEEFTSPKAKIKSFKRGDIYESELSYTQIQKINQELKKIWLK